MAAAGGDHWPVAGRSVDTLAGKALDLSSWRFVARAPRYRCVRSVTGRNRARCDGPEHVEVVAMQHLYAGTDREGSIRQSISRRTVSPSRPQRRYSLAPSSYGVR